MQRRVRWGISSVSSRMGILQDVNIHKGMYLMGLLLALKHIVVRIWGNQIAFKDYSRL